MISRFFPCLFPALAFFILAPDSGLASPPNIVNHQGRISVDGENFTGTGHFKFALISVQFNSAQWTHDGTSSGANDEPDSSVPVTVTKGHYAIPLGDTSFHANMSEPIPASALTIFAAQNGLSLRTWFSPTGTLGSFERLIPDRRLTSAPFSIVSQVTEGVAGDLDMENNELTNAFKVGIGVAEPASRLHIRNEDLTLPTTYSSQILVEAQGASLGLFTKRPIGAQNFAQPKIRLGEGLAELGSFIQFRKIATNAATIPNALVLDWGTATGSSSSTSPRFVFTENSRLGVGASNPEAAVHVIGGTTPTVKIESNGTNEESGRLSLRQSDESGVDLYYDGGNSAEGLRIDAIVTGAPQATSLFVSNASTTRRNVGIHTTDPLSPLHVSGTARMTLLHAGAGTPAARNYNYIANDDPVPISGDISNSIDLFMSGDLEARRIYGTFLPPSDRNLKEGFEAIDVREVLDKVSALPITTWQYKARPGDDEEAQGPASRHIGPIAQDFHAAFRVGYNDKTIATIDADGVALAAIQALKALNDEKDREIAELKARLKAIESKLGLRVKD